ncbi:EamA family transporter [Metabacillus bambusae]|uniref:EamA family transporter n=1 Tax=Metabacillus bambusae TaxID=2795218 RepID=A0ABS3MY55_9BACI|nr:DMT family transporter [Metabacillus bambusae]MBO1510921.1 EamA family transporter [Metabacillus bambusae]
MMLKYSSLVLLGACSYGILSVIVKLAYKQGFTVSKVIGSQYLFGFLLMLVPFLFLKKSFTRKDVLSLIVAGITTSLTGLFYGKSLETLSASIAVVLLFQFTWIGIIIEALANRKAPSKEKICAMIILFIGTILAGGGLTNSLLDLSPIGVIYGLLSAVSFAFFIFVSGRVAIHLPALTRSFFMSTGALLFLLIILSPDFIINGSLGDGLWKYGSLLGFFGVLLPVLLFSIGAPKIGTGLATIIGAAELPTAVIASVIILNEHVSFTQIIGVLIILIGIAAPHLLQLKKQGTVPHRA